MEQRNDKESKNDLKDFDFTDDQIEALLDESLLNVYKEAPKNKKLPYCKAEKLVLEEKGINCLEFLPVDWIIARHESGIPIYLHRPSRVCTLSKPYYLGPDRLKSHEIPISAIPCLNYRRALDDEEMLQKFYTNVNENKNSSVNDTLIDEDCDNISKKKPRFEIDISNKSELSDSSKNEEGLKKNAVDTEFLKKSVNTDTMDKEKALLLPSVKVETPKQNWKNSHLRHSEVTEYCKKLFRFKNIQYLSFNSISERHEYLKKKKTIKKLIQLDSHKFAGKTTIVNNKDKSAAKSTKTIEGKFFIPEGKSALCVLFEYVQKVFKTQHTYEFKELENSATPFSATVLINGIHYGIGYGKSKRLAKLAAAKATVEILIPEMKGKMLEDKDMNENTDGAWEENLAFFDNISIDNPCVISFCAKTMDNFPYTILQTCLSQNFDVDDREIKLQMEPSNYLEYKLTMTVGDHTASVICKNKEDGKHRASQAILQALHPNISSWGSLLRLYGKQSAKP